MSDEQGSDRKWDKKSLGVGGVSVAALLTILQSQGITLMNSHQEAKNAQVLEKVVKSELRDKAQDEKINKLERSLDNIQTQIRDGFRESRIDLRGEIEKLSDIVRMGSADRYTKTEHMSFVRELNARFQRNEENIKDLQKAVNQKER